MNTVDKQYLNILKDIIENGVVKDTRAGKTLSVFGRQMRINLKDGFPLLTTKKLYTKGIIHELLWFLKGDTNIKYLVDNDVHIWDDDAYRYFNEIIDKHYTPNIRAEIGYLPKNKEEFIDYVKGRKLAINHASETYFVGDLGPIYGKQWRDGKDQIAQIVKTLKTDPDNRRIILTAWNVMDLDDMALPPCHVFAQFYTRPLTFCEVYNSLKDRNSLIRDVNMPKYALSCMFFCRSQDFPLGTPFNIASYALLTHMLAHVCNMDVGELIWNGGDCHVYLNQVEAVKEQLKRTPCETLPTLKLNENVTDIDDFKYDDIQIENYKSQAPIKIPLSVGL